MTIKIWTQKELFKGYIPSDKITRRGVKFEHFSLSFFDSVHLDHKKVKRMLVNFRQMNKVNELINYLKFFIRRSKKFKQLEKEDYHKHIYLNLNFDGVDCYLDR